MSKNKKPQVPTKIEAGKPEKPVPYAKSFTEGVVDTAVTAGSVATAVAGATALAHAMTKGNLDPATAFLVSVLGTGVAKILTNGTMRLYDKITEPHEEPNQKPTLVGSKQVKGLEQAEQPKQLAAPVVRHGADQKLLPTVGQEGTQAMKAAIEETPKVHAAARPKHNNHAPKHKRH